MTAKERSESTGMESGQQWREMTKEMERDVKRTVSEFPRRSKKVPWALRRRTLLPLTACIFACSSGLQYSFRISRHSTRQNTFQLYTVTVRTGRRSDWITRSREKPWHSHPWSDGKSLVGSLGCYDLFSEEEKTAYGIFWLAVAVSCCL